MKKLIFCILLLTTNLLFGQWIQQNTNFYPVPLKSIYFIDENTGWAVGGSLNNPSPVLWTNDGGDTWLETNLIEKCNSVYFTNIDTGFIGGSIEDNGEQTTMWHTQNGISGVSTTWNEQLWNGAGEIKAMSFVDAQNGWAIEYDCFWHCNYKILKTSDGGGTWAYQTGGNNAALLDICFANANYGWAVGRDHIASINPLICRTTDGGLNWESKIIEMEDHITLQGVAFPDSIHGWTVGNVGTILHTSNGGETWEFQNSGSYSSLRDVYFCDSIKGWAVGDNGTIIHTVDGGVNWESQESGTMEDLWSVFFIDQNMGWITGDNYTILQAIDGGVGIESHYEDQHNLSLVPNPFKKDTKILFTLHDKSNLNVSVINLNGQEVASIFKGTMDKGSHEIIWTSNNLPPAIYFLRLETDKGTSMKKIIKQ